MNNDWPKDFPEVTSLVPYASLRHNTDPEMAELYDQAKNHEDREAAAELIDRLISDEDIEKIKSFASRHPNAIITAVHALEGKGKNAIPSTLAYLISEKTGLEVDTTIVQSSVVNKTGVKSTWYRLAHHAYFEGAVQAGRDYILVDDVFSSGGTLNEARWFIESRGGTVVDSITLANGAKSMDAHLAVTPQHVLELERKFGIESLQQFLKEESIYEGNHNALTDAQARTLLGSPSLDQARDRITAARQEGNNRVRSQMVLGTSPETRPQEVTTLDHITPDTAAYPASSFPSQTLSPGQNHVTKENNMAEEFESAGQAAPEEYLSKLEAKMEERAWELTRKAAYEALQRSSGDVSAPEEHAWELSREDIAGLKEYINKGSGGYWLDTEVISTPGYKVWTPLDVIKEKISEAELKRDAMELKTGAQNLLVEQKKNSKENSMSDEFEDVYPDEIESEVNPIADMDEQEKIITSSRTPEEAAFKNGCYQTTLLKKSIENGSHAIMPGADGYADTSPAINVVNGTRYHGENLLYLKDHQKRNGWQTAEYATQDAIQKSGIPIKKGEHGITISFNEKQKDNTWKTINVKLFNIAQVIDSQKLIAYGKQVQAEKQEETQAYLKEKYGESYKPLAERKKEQFNEIVANSAKPERYIAQYMAAVSLGTKFKVPPNIAAQFKENALETFNAPFLKEGVAQKYPDPFAIKHTCVKASQLCKDEMVSVRMRDYPQQQQQQQQQTQGRSR